MVSVPKLERLSRNIAALNQQNRILLSAVREIASSDPIENALDPQRNARIASAALAASVAPPSEPV